MIPEYHLINIWFHNRLPLLTSDQPHLNYLCDCNGIRTHNQFNYIIYFNYINCNYVTKLYYTTHISHDIFKRT